MSEPASRRRVLAKRFLQAAISLTIVIGIFVGVLPRFASYEDVWATITAMTDLELSTLGLIGAWNIITYWFVMVAVLPGLRFREAAVVNQASTAVSNTLPAGGAIGVGVTYAMYTSWGFQAPEIALSALVSGVWNNFVKLGMPVLAVAMLALTGDVTGTRVLAAGAGLIALALAEIAAQRNLDTEPPVGGVDITCPVVALGETVGCGQLDHGLGYCAFSYTGQWCFPGPRYSSS